MKKGENMKTRESTSRAAKVQKSLNSLWLFVILRRDQPLKINLREYDQRPTYLDSRIHVWEYPLSLAVLSTLNIYMNVAEYFMCQK